MCLMQCLIYIQQSGDDGLGFNGLNHRLVPERPCGPNTSPNRQKLSQTVCLLALIKSYAFSIETLTFLFLCALSSQGLRLSLPCCNSKAYLDSLTREKLVRFGKVETREGEGTEEKSQCPESNDLVDRRNVPICRQISLFSNPFLPAWIYQSSEILVHVSHLSPKSFKKNTLSLALVGKGNRHSAFYQWTGLLLSFSLHIETVTKKN